MFKTASPNISQEAVELILDAAATSPWPSEHDEMREGVFTGFALALGALLSCEERPAEEILIEAITEGRGALPRAQRPDAQFSRPTRDETEATAWARVALDDDVARYAAAASQRIYDDGIRRRPPAAASEEAEAEVKATAELGFALGEFQAAAAKLARVWDEFGEWDSIANYPSWMPSFDEAALAIGEMEVR